MHTIQTSCLCLEEMRQQLECTITWKLWRLFLNLYFRRLFSEIFLLGKYVRSSEWVLFLSVEDLWHCGLSVPRVPTNRKMLERSKVLKRHFLPNICATNPRHQFRCDVASRPHSSWLLQLMTGKTWHVVQQVDGWEMVTSEPARNFLQTQTCSLLIFMSWIKVFCCLFQ